MRWKMARRHTRMHGTKRTPRTIANIGNTHFVLQPAHLVWTGLIGWCSASLQVASTRPLRWSRAGMVRASFLLCGLLTLIEGDMLVCLPDDDCVVLCNAETREQFAIKLEGMPWGYTATCCVIAPFFCHGLHERPRTTLGFWEIPSERNAECGAHHHSDPSTVTQAVSTVALWICGGGARLRAYHRLTHSAAGMKDSILSSRTSSAALA